jgi:hypothetical protein
MPGKAEAPRSDHERTIESLQEATKRLAEAQAALRENEAGTSGIAGGRHWDRKIWDSLR